MAQEPVVRGAVYLASFGESDPGRPVIVVQNDPANKFAPQTIVAAVRFEGGAGLPVHVPVPAEAAGLEQNCVIDCGFLAAIPKERLVRRLGRLSTEHLRRLDAALRQSLGLS